MKTLFVLALVSFLIGCGKQIELPQVPQTPASSATPDTANNSVTPETPASPSGPVTFSLSVYSVTKTIAPNSSFPAKTYTATGRCAVYSGKTYCWDDGMKTVVISGFSFTYSYFNMNKTVGGYSHSNGGMTADLMVVPFVIAGGLAINMAAGDVNEVLHTGTGSTATCSETNGIVDCVSFAIDTNQLPL